MHDISFTVYEDESGGYYAHAQMGAHDLFTQGETLDELRANLLEVSLLYLENLAEETGEPMPAEAKYSMIFSAPVRIPA